MGLLMDLQVPGASYAATSTTSLTIGTGSKNFTTQAGLAYLAGMRVRAVSAADTANWMEGVVAAYSATTLSTTIDLVGGSGTLADWNIGIAGQPGVPSDLSGDTGTATAPPSIAIEGAGGASVAVTQAGGAGTAATVEVTASAGSSPYLGTTPDAPIPLAPVNYVLSYLENIPDCTYYNGPDDDGIGATLTEDDPTDGVLTADGVNPGVGQRLLFDADPAGIYSVTATGDGATVPWQLTRATDCDSLAKRYRFWTVGVLSGDTFALGSVHVAIADPGTGNLEPAVEGSGATASGGGAIASGANSVALACGVASGAFAVSLGGQALGANSFAAGGGTASKEFSVATGFGSVAADTGQRSHSSGGTGLSSGQISDATATQQTTDNTPTVLWNDTGGQFTFRQISGVADYTKTAVVHGRIVGRRTDTPGTDSAWDFAGVIRGDGSTAYSWIGGSDPVPAIIAQDAAASTWAVAVTISGASIVVTVTGETGKTIDWMCTLELDEVV